MPRSAHLASLVASLALLAASIPAAYAEPLTWPWKDKTPPDPALTSLTSVEGVYTCPDNHAGTPPYEF